jgi:hypothetical protein
VIITVYIGESGTHESGYTILGGWVGRLGQWAGFDPKWDKLLKRSELTYFHSKKLRGSQGEFKGWRPERKEAFMDRAATLAIKNLEFGFSVTMRDDDYKRHYLRGGRPRGGRLDSRYGLCFRHLLSFVTHHTIDAFKKADDHKIHFVMESGHRNYGDAERIFNEVKKSQLSNEKYIVETLATITSADKKDFPGLQIADVSAYATYQHHTRRPLELTALDPSSSMRDAKKVQKTPILHFPMEVEVISTYRKFVDDAAKEKEERKLAHLARFPGKKPV